MYTLSPNSVEILATFASKGRWTPTGIFEITLLLHSVGKYHFCAQVWRQNCLCADDKITGGVGVGVEF